MIFSAQQDKAEFAHGLFYDHHRTEFDVVEGFPLLALLIKTRTKRQNLSAWEGPQSHAPM